MSRVIDGVVYTPNTLASFAVELMQACATRAGLPQIMEVWDPCCGDGALLAAYRQVVDGAKCCGIDNDTDAVAGASARGFDVQQADLFTYRPQGKINRLLCNPPYVGRSNIRGVVGNDRFT